MNHDPCCDEPCDAGRRNRFFPRKRTTPDTWQVEQDYQQQRRRLINRAVHGWGVVYGFELTLAKDDTCVGDGGQGLVIGNGFALDPCGRELVQINQGRPLAVEDFIAFDLKGNYVPPPEPGCGTRPKGFPFPPEAEKLCVLLRVHYAERLISPVPVKDPCACDDTEWDQVCETVRYSLSLVDCQGCCAPQGCGLNCECRRDGEKPSRCCSPEEHKPSERGGCRCLCEHLTALDPTPECCALTRVGMNLKVDLRHGVALGCLRLTLDKCGEWTFSKVEDACGPRRLVKRNDLLFDLIRGCDLTRISRISWADWHRNRNGLVKFEEFAAKFGKGEKAAQVTDFWIEFSKGVDVKTLKRDAFTMTLIARNDEDGWGRTLRVPIVDIEVADPAKPYSTTARILVDPRWAAGALDSISVFGSGVTRFEISVRGDYLLDCNGQMVDANARGLEPAPTGNGTPGDTFFSTFLIERREAKEDPNEQSF
jgi:hypothetical protein